MAGSEPLVMETSSVAGVITSLAKQIGIGNYERGFREEGDDVRRAAEGAIDTNLESYNQARLADYYAKRLLLIVSEAVEAFEEALRDGHTVDEVWYKIGTTPVRRSTEPGVDWEAITVLDGVRATWTGVVAKPHGFRSEVADVLIRAMDLGDEITDDIGGDVMEKLAYNATRPFKHGRKF